MEMGGPDSMQKYSVVANFVQVSVYIELGRSTVFGNRSNAVERWSMKDM